MAEKFNLSLKTTAANSPWSNGIVEHHNAILIEIIKKVKEKKCYFIGNCNKMGSECKELFGKCTWI